MGLNYSFEFISKTENRLKLLEAFSKRLSKDCRDKFGSFDKYEPEYEDLITDSWEEIYIIKMGIKLFGNKGDYINNNSYCFSILPEIDESVESYFSNSGYTPDRENGRLLIGCAWTSLYVGEENVLLEVTAATSNMSRLFEKSKSIHKLCSDIAEEAENTSVFLDKENQLYWWQIFPESKKFIKPDQNLFSNYQKTLIINVDAYIMEAERLAGNELC